MLFDDAKERFDMVEYEREVEEAKAAGKEPPPRPGGLEAVAKKKRWQPIREGRLAIVQLTDIEKSRTSKSTYYSVKATVMAGIHSGRFVWQKFFVYGHPKSVKASRIFLARATSCLEGVECDDLDFTVLEGAVVPVRFRIVPHWESGKPTNEFDALAADPTSVTYPNYCTLAKKVTDAMPGWDLFPMSRAKLIVEREIKIRNERNRWSPQSDGDGEIRRTVKIDGDAPRRVVVFGPPEFKLVTTAEARKVNNSFRAVAKMAKAKEESE